MTPEEALARARAAAPHQTGYIEGPVSLDAKPIGRLPIGKLLEWALIEPDVERVYSTRRGGAPITFAKRGLIQALRQYLGDAFAQDSRFNMLAAAHIINLEERIRALEDRLQLDDDGDAA